MKLNYEYNICDDANTKIETFTIDYKDNLYKVQIRYLKSFVEWRFMYYEWKNKKM